MNRLDPAIFAPAHTALLVIDIQKDFGAPGFAMAQAGMVMEPVEAALAASIRLIDAARSAHVPVVFIRVITRPETDSRAVRRFFERIGYGADAAAICRAGTEGAAYYRVAPELGEIEVEKTLYNAFAGTRLETILRERGIETLVLCGLTTDCCVDGTARDAFERNFDVFIARDACAAFDPQTHENALAILGTHSAIAVDSASVREAWTVPAKA